MRIQIRLEQSNQVTPVRNVESNLTSDPNPVSRYLGSELILNTGYGSLNPDPKHTFYCKIKVDLQDEEKMAIIYSEYRSRLNFQVLNRLSNQEVPNSEVDCLLSNKEFNLVPFYFINFL